MDVTLPGIDILVNPLPIKARSFIVFTPFAIERLKFVFAPALANALSPISVTDPGI